jgi:hypothetical protein
MGNPNITARLGAALIWRRRAMAQAVVTDRGL